MTDAHFWRVLGIAPVDDESLIRKAYAQRLKRTNPEDDPEGFKALRAAYESALRHAQFRKWRTSPDEDSFYDAGDDDGVGAPSGSTTSHDARASDPFAASAEMTNAAAVEEPAGEPPTPDQRARREAVAAHYRARSELAAALYDGESPWRLLEALETLLTSKAMEAVGVYASAERWLLDLIRDTRPTSDLLVERAVEFFGWGARVAPRGGASLAADAFALLEGIRQDHAAHGFLGRVRDRRHEFHPAFKQTSRSPNARNWLSRFLSLRHLALVRRFLHHVDDRAPMAVLELDADAVDWWRGRIRRLTPAFSVLRWIARAFAIAVVLIVLAAVVPQTDRHATPTAQARAECRSAISASLLRSRSKTGLNPLYARVNRSLLDAAREDCQRALTLAPDSLVLMQYAGIAGLKGGDSAGALERFRAISAKSPADPFALYGQGLAQRMLHGPQETDLLRQALKLDRGVEAYFREFGVDVPTGLSPADAEPSPIAPRPRPPIDTPPRSRGSLDQSVYDEAYLHFGISSPLEGRVVLECLARDSGVYTDCRILEEAPRNLGLGELAVRVAGAIKIEPAALRGAPVDAVPIRIPFTFKIED